MNPFEQRPWDPVGQTGTVRPNSLERWLTEGFTPAQVEGVACIECGEYTEPMVPAGRGPLGQLVRHEACGSEVI